jgi:predicted DNA-binding transcriptional regulator AlpA
VDAAISDNSRPLLSGLLTLEELAGELGRSPRTIERWLVRREGPIQARTKIGRAVYFDRAAVLAWIASRRESPTPKPRRRRRRLA